MRIHGVIITDPAFKRDVSPLMHIIKEKEAEKNEQKVMRILWVIA